ncbi:hypothetical protein PSACC_03281 [Paramicrosporidium saccamoebae]|uniref:Uncharacterized protein n=1 Tax=Paramicrosporidium saccamoebae TaxID=1246581 RepID=A0A2H9TGJ8_9FUNG|nr:hypothetical protein PSACC_03281 [Paramicrosporidium saccamoebae]
MPIRWRSRKSTCPGTLMTLGALVNLLFVPMMAEGHFVLVMGTDVDGVLRGKIVPKDKVKSGNENDMGIGDGGGLDL